MNAALLILGLAVPAAADTVTLDNGRTLEGTVKSETASEVVLDFGSGETILPRDRIRSIEKGKAKRRAVDAAGAESAPAVTDASYYFLQDKYVPAKQKRLAKAFEDLLDLREDAENARQEIDAWEEEASEAERDLAGIQERVRETNEALRRADKTDVARYNEAVARVNEAVAEFREKHLLIESNADATKEAEGRIEAYGAAYAKLKSAHRAAWRRAGKNAPRREKRFLEAMGEKLAGYAKEFHDVTVPAKRSGGTTLVPAALRATPDGNPVRGTFVVDTGASMLTLGPKLAKRLRVDGKRLPKVRVVLADGEEVEAQYLTLYSVNVGKAEALRVPAVILPRAPGKGIDGLLGMSFLRHFTLHIDGKTGTMRLRAFKPSKRR